VRVLYRHNSLSAVVQYSRITAVGFVTDGRESQQIEQLCPLVAK
jgi:hypothetical protein